MKDAEYWQTASAIGAGVLIKIPDQLVICWLHTAPTYFIYHWQAASDANQYSNTDIFFSLGYNIEALRQISDPGVLVPLAP